MHTSASLITFTLVQLMRELERVRLSQAQRAELLVLIDRLRARIERVPQCG